MLELVNGLPLPKGVSPSFPSLNPLWLAVVEGRQQGRVFVVSGDEPTGGLICSTATGFYFLFGDPDASWVDRDLARLLGEIDHKAGWFGLLVERKHWRSRLQEIFGADTATSTRVQFGFDRRKAEDALASVVKTELSVVPMDEVTTPLVLSAGLSSVFGTLWPSMDDFLRDGFGFCVFHDGQAASACYTYSACVSSGDVEIAVGTVESFRGRGLAKAVCGAAIQHCLDSRLSPQWSCLVDNVASIRLAQSLGYELGEEYTVFFPNLGN